MNEEYTDESGEESEAESVHSVINPLPNEEDLSAQQISRQNSCKMMSIYMYMMFQSMSYGCNEDFLPNQPQDIYIALLQNIPPSNIGFRQLLAKTIRHVKSRPRAHQPEGAILHFLPKWRRLVAELIDFLYLCIFRFIVHFYFCDIVNFIGLYEFLYPKYCVEMSMTSKFILCEIIHRIIVFLYEAYHLRKPVGNQHMGGATPGKIYMNLRVVKCDQVIDFEEYPFDVCWVKPGTNLDLKHAIARSFTKNILLVVLSPFWFGMCRCRYDRTWYDVVSHTIVVHVPG